MCSFLQKIAVKDTSIRWRGCRESEISMRASSDIEQTINAHGDAVWRACLVYLAPSEAEDAFQNTFMKYASKEYVYMPPTCSCATTAAPAAAAGVAFLHGLTPQQINDMLCTAQVQMAGVVCDGAKPSCATRMYVALFGSLQAMMMAKEGIRATNVEGFVHNDLKVTLENLYRLQHDVLHNKVDAILWDIVKEQKVIH